MKTLNWRSKNLEEIKNVPDNIEILDCSDNLISKILPGRLPITLQEFSCSNNYIKIIENLPRGLKCFNYYFLNPISFVDNLTMNEYRKLTGEYFFNIEWYNKFKFYQRRIRFRYQRRDKAARIIQKGCWSWVWGNPKYDMYCKDGTFPINVKLGLRLINNQRF